jgi:hypothetical protein
MGAVILAAVKFGALILSTLVIDRYGRKVLVMAGAVIMVVCQVSIFRHGCIQSINRYV